MSDNEVQFPGMTPDYLTEYDKMDGECRSEHGVGWVHVSLLRSYAGDCAVTASQTENPSEKELWQRRERWFDEAASVIERLCPPRVCDKCKQEEHPEHGCVCGIDTSMIYCQGCGAAPHTDGSRCGPQCAVQQYPPVASHPADPERADLPLPDATGPDADAENDPAIADLLTYCAFCGLRHDQPSNVRECPCSRHIDGGSGPVCGPCNAAPAEPEKETPADGRSP